jgi:hypothetical protein
MNTMMKLISPHQASQVMLAAALTLAATSSQAATRVGNSSTDGVAAGTTPELMLFIWDPVKEVSYTKDLGITVYGENYAGGDAATNLFVYGQQNTGFQKLFDPLNSDTKFQSFLSASTNIADQMWAVIAVSSDPLGFGPGARALYTTLRHSVPTGTSNPEYETLTKFQQIEFESAAGGFESNVSNINTVCDGSNCNTDFAANLSTQTRKGEIGYAGDAFTSNGALLGSTMSPSIFNAVNSSSWFYKLTMASYESGDPIVIDEFDNDANDAYWGLGVDSNGNYILSYTLAAKLTPVATFEGQLNRLRTDFTAQYGGIRFIDVPAGDTLSLGSSISPVPEPATWGLMGLGLAVLAARARRRA